MEPGKPEAVEYEYERYGTQALIATFRRNWAGDQPNSRGYPY